VYTVICFDWAAVALWLMPPLIYVEVTQCATDGGAMNKKPGGLYVDFKPLDESDLEGFSFAGEIGEAVRAQEHPNGGSPRVLVLGGTGYIGGRLVPRLLAAGYRVRIMSRSSARVNAMYWSNRVETQAGDASDSGAVQAALRDVDIVYYLLHPIDAGRKFIKQDRQIAQTVVQAAESAGVKRIVHLGEAPTANDPRPSHPARRTAVSDILLNSAIPSVVLRTGVIIGSGSASFEMVRRLTEALPYTPAPRWVHSLVQPIAIRDVLYYLLAAAKVTTEASGAYEIGGPEVWKYGQMMNAYAVEAGLSQRKIIALPVFTPQLASCWVSLVSSIPRKVAKPMVETLLHDRVVDTRAIHSIIPKPQGGLTSYRHAVRLALQRIKSDTVETSWLTARRPQSPSEVLPSDPKWAKGKVFTHFREHNSDVSASQAWRTILNIGEFTAWYSAPVLWSFRGWIDQGFGGAGFKRSHNTASRVSVGDHMHMWRVEHLEAERVLRLRAEMRAPGDAWLELGIHPTPDGCRYWQRSVFFPRGISGLIYWLSMLPFHHFVFRSVTKRIGPRAEVAR
jgi:uncharacterized protein YbjT (DUF2867 family)